MVELCLFPGNAPGRTADDRFRTFVIWPVVPERLPNNEPRPRAATVVYTVRASGVRVFTDYRSTTCPATTRCPYGRSLKTTCSFGGRVRSCTGLPAMRIAITPLLLDSPEELRVRVSTQFKCLRRCARPRSCTSSSCEPTPKDYDFMVGLAMATRGPASLDILFLSTHKTFGHLSEQLNYTCRPLVPSHRCTATTRLQRIAFLQMSRTCLVL